jgi:hypothetical protein
MSWFRARGAFGLKGHAMIKRGLETRALLAQPRRTTTEIPSHPPNQVLLKVH